MMKVLCSPSALTPLIEGKSKKWDVYLLTIFLLVNLAILFKLWLGSSGYTSSDSIHYLDLAQNLLDGKGVYIDGKLFSVWPVGYPVLIFSLSKILNISVFWSSKILSILFVSGVFFLFRLFFRNTAYLYALLFMLFSYMEIFTHTWSESVFLPLLILYCFLVWMLLTNVTSYYGYVLLFFVVLLLAFTRYIGFFATLYTLVIALLCFYLGAKRKFFLFSSVFLISFALFISYLYFNYSETGYITGEAREGARETNIQYIYMLLKGISYEFLLPVIGVSTERFGSWGIGVVIIYLLAVTILMASGRFSFKSSTEDEDFAGVNDIKPYHIFFTVSLFYFVFIIALRYISHFDSLGYRLLGPGSFLLFISIINYFETRLEKKAFVNFTCFLLFSASLSYAYNIIDFVRLMV